MKRSEALTPLSHDHHQALFVAMQLRRADEESAASAGQAMLAFWNDYGRRHFREEEELLLPAFVPYGDVEHPLVGRALVEHVTIRARIRALERSMPDPDPAAVRELGDALHTHVRFEERELFPMIEAALPPDALAELAAALDHDD